jgi:hypothetical protein
VVDNDFFGIGVFNGAFQISHTHVRGGGGGLWVIADGADTSVVLDHVSFSHLSGPVVEKVENGGTATVTGEP